MDRGQRWQKVYQPGHYQSICPHAFIYILSSCNIRVDTHFANSALCPYKWRVVATPMGPGTAIGQHETDRLNLKTDYCF